MRKTRKEARKRREWERRHADLLQAAADLFHAHGYEETSVQAVAERAGFSVGYLYKHFPGKPELLEAVLMVFFHTVERIRSEVSEDVDLSPLSQVRLELVRICEFLAENAPLVLVFAQHENRLAPRLQGRLDKLRRYEVLRLRNAHADGEIPPVNFGLLAATIDGVFLNLVRRYVGAPPAEGLSRIPEIVDQFILRPLEERSQRNPGKEYSNA